MLDLIADYLLFLAKTATIIGGLIFLLSVVVATGQRIRKLEKQGHIEVSCLNEKFDEMSHAIQSVVLPAADYEKFCKAEKKARKASEKASKFEPVRPRVFVIDFNGDLRATAGDALAEQVSAILIHAGRSDEVVVRLESAGGMVHGYGLAAAQLQRIRNKDIPLTVCVDKVAASGGYMMACIANQVLAAPFAMVGSIGVVAQLPNVHRLLKKHDIDYEMMTAGEYKRTLTVFAENTEKGRQKFQQELEETHDLFKQFVARHRPVLDVADVATGEVWYGQQAVQKGLVDKIMTSDEYLFAKYPTADLFQVEWVEKQGLAEKMGIVAETAAGRLLLRGLDFLENRANFFR